MTRQTDILERLADVWLRRHARSAPEAISAVAQLTPATVITGASEGLGLALARRIAREGRAVVLIARSQAALQSAADELRIAHPSTVVIAAAIDVGRMDAYERIAEVLARNKLYLDVLVNNAGIALSGPF